MDPSVFPFFVWDHDTVFMKIPQREIDTRWPPPLTSWNPHEVYLYIICPINPYKFHQVLKWLRWGGSARWSPPFFRCRFSSPCWAWRIWGLTLWRQWVFVEVEVVVLWYVYNCIYICIYIWYVYVYIYICIYIYDMYMSIYVCIYIWYVYVYIYMYIYDMYMSIYDMYMSIYICIYMICICLYICIYIWYVYVYICIWYVYVYICIYIWSVYVYIYDMYMSIYM